MIILELFDFDFVSIFAAKHLSLWSGEHLSNSVWAVKSFLIDFTELVSEDGLLFCIITSVKSIRYINLKTI